MLLWHVQRISTLKLEGLRLIHIRTMVDDLALAFHNKEGFIRNSLEEELSSRFVGSWSLFPCTNKRVGLHCIEEIKVNRNDDGSRLFGRGVVAVDF